MTSKLNQKRTSSTLKEIIDAVKYDIRQMDRTLKGLKEIDTATFYHYEGKQFYAFAILRFLVDKLRIEKHG